jgi:hypothetical protein
MRALASRRVGNTEAAPSPTPLGFAESPSP